MLRRKERLFVQIMLLADLITLAGSFAFSYWLRIQLSKTGFAAMPRFHQYIWVIFIIEPAFLISLLRVGLYRSNTYHSRGRIVVAVGKASVLGILLVISALYMMKEPDLSRFVLNIFAIVSIVALSAEKLAVNAILLRSAEHRRKRKEWRVLVVGESEYATEYLNLLKAHPHWGVTVAGIVSPRQSALVLAAVGGRMEASASRPANWHQTLKAYVVDEVVAVMPSNATHIVADLERVCVERGVIFRILVMMAPPQVGRYDIDDMGEGRYMISLESVPQEFLPLLIKRAMDIAGSLVGLLLCGVVYLCYAPRLRREAPGPVLFKQDRGGHSGRIFTLYKFRTMLVDAERSLPQLLSRNSVTGVMFKMKDDPRVIPSGRFLRRTHLDELPQFWNVLIGDMSLVGPRPNPAREVTGYDDRHYRRLSMKPGLTGIFQIYGHAAIDDFDEVVKLDCQYIDEWSLVLDCKIILKTVAKMFRADGW
ncbi:MAG: sugar transferase [Candidatus Binataceae bacterium]